MAMPMAVAMAMTPPTSLASSFTAARPAPSFREYGCSGKKSKVAVQCSLQSALQSAAVATSAAALLLFAPASGVILPACGVLFGFLYISFVHKHTEVALAEPLLGSGSLCEIAATPDATESITLDERVGIVLESVEDGPDSIMSAGMTMKNFNPSRYAGRWFEVASLKLGFAGQGQEDCHCTQGLYSYIEKKQAIEVETFCVHGSPTGYVTGIRGRVQCVTDQELKKLKISDFERMQMVRQKCYLRFPNLPFIPRQPYNVLDTDYDNYALVSGAKDASFIQIYSRTPNPGRDFIEKQKAVLATLGYDADDIKDTPQDCEQMTLNEINSMMADPGVEKALDNTIDTPGLTKGVQLNPFTSNLETLKKLVQLYLPKFK